MKPNAIYTLMIVAAMVATGCRQRIVTDDMDNAEKLEVLDLQIEKHPNDAALRASRAQVLLGLGRPKEALLDIGKAVSVEPKNAGYLMLQADIYFANGNADYSYRSLTDAQALEPDNIEIQLKQGEIAFYTGDMDRSMRHLTAVTERQPDNRTALFMKGFIYKEQGDTANAITLMRRVCDLYPDYAPAFEQLGVIYANRQLPMAEEYLGTALRLDPTNTNTIYALAQYHQDLEQMEQAEALYRRLLDINPNSSDAWHNLGYIDLFFYHDYERAIENFSRAIEADELNERALAHRGNAYELNGEADKARADYEAALAIEPGFYTAAEGMKRLKRTNNTNTK